VTDCIHYIQDCAKLSQAFNKLGFPSLECEDCKLINNLELVDMLDQPEDIEQRAILDILDSLAAPPAEVHPDFDFRCNRLQMYLRCSCQLHSCGYWVEWPQTYNCLWAYFQQQEVEGLTPEEISYLYRLPLADVQHSLYEAMVKLRESSLKVAAIQNDLPRNFNFIITERVCCVCEQVIEVPALLTVRSLGLAYCSRHCKTLKPPRIIELEHQYGLEIKNILSWALAHFHNLSTAEHALGMNRWMLYEACQRFLGRDPEDFFPGLRAMKKHRQSSLVRRTWHAPKWVDEMLVKLKPVTRLIEAKYGIAGVDFSPVQDKLADILKTL